MSLWDDVIETPQNRRRNRRRKAARLAAARKILTEDESWNDAIKKEARRQSRYLRERTEKKLRERVNEAKRKGLPQPDWDGPRAADGTPLAKPAVLSKRQAARQRKLDEIRERALQAEAADERIREAERKDRKERKKRRVQPGDYDVVVRQVRRKKGVVKIDETLGEASHRPRKGPYADPPYTGLSNCPRLSQEEKEEFPLLNPPVENARDLCNAMAVLHFQVRLRVKYNISEARLRETTSGLCYFCNGGTDTVVLLRANEDLEVPACRFFTHAECWSMARVLQVMTP